MARGRQTKLEAVEDKYNPEVHQAAEQYLEDRQVFQDASKAVQRSKDALIEKMEQYELPVYEDDDVRVVLEKEDEPKKKLKVTNLTLKAAGDE